MERKIIHIDADCFFAALEMRDNPALRARPMAVGGRSDRRGVIATCNYEARHFGVRSAMSSAHALQLCPELQIVPGRMSVYRQASEQMRAIFFDYTDKVEPLSLDEAYLDVSLSDRCQGSATLMAEQIRQRIVDAIQITVSAGVAPNKFLAKVASDWRKPDGLTVIPPAAVDDFVKPLAVGKIYGVGKVTEAKLHQQGLYTCGDLRERSALELSDHFGSFGSRLHQLSRGEDDRPVVSSRRRKSLSLEHTFANDLPTLDDCLAALPPLYSELQQRLDKLDDSYRVIKTFVKVKFSDFTATTLERAATAPRVSRYRELLIEAFARGQLPVRLLGLGVRFGDSDEEFSQLSLFDS